MVKKALAATAVAAGLVAGVALGGSTGAWESAGVRFAQDAFDPDPRRDQWWTVETAPAVVAIDVVANYCTPTPCRPR
jgi:hypothetical protein